MHKKQVRADLSDGKKPEKRWWVIKRHIPFFPTLLSPLMIGKRNKIESFKDSRLFFLGVSYFLGVSLARVFRRTAGLMCIGAIGGLSCLGEKFG